MTQRGTPVMWRCPTSFEMNNADHSMLAGTRKIYSPTHTHTDMLTLQVYVHTGVGVLT